MNEEIKTKTSVEIYKANQYLDTLKRSDHFPVREAIGIGFIEGQRSQQSRITELEAENKELREALDNIKQERLNPTTFLFSKFAYNIIIKVEQALKP